jgi:hypothetical protein
MGTPPVGRPIPIERAASLWDEAYRAIKDQLVSGRLERGKTAVFGLNTASHQSRFQEAIREHRGIERSIRAATPNIEGGLR